MIIYDWMGHMVSTESADELHKFAKALGLKREWFQTPAVSKATGKVAELGAEYNAHYDLTTERMKAKAGRMGAVEVESFALVKAAWWRKS